MTRAEYFCHSCGELAGWAELKIDVGYTEAALVVNGIVGRITTWVETDQLLRITNFIERGSAKELFEWEHDSASFYCPTCDQVYCKTHWQTELVFENEPDLPGWYDCTCGTCPQGHRRIIDD